MTLQGPLEFDLPIWESISELAKDIINGLLMKDPTKRLTLDRVIAHPWFKNV